MRDKYKIFLVLCLMLIMVITGCGKESKNEPEVTPTPEVTTTPTPEPTPTPVEDRYVDLTEEERDELYELSSKYKGRKPDDPYYGFSDGQMRDGYCYNWVTCEIVAYYKYIDLEEFVLPVVTDYSLVEAEELFGGEWEVMEDVRVDLVFPYDTMHNEDWLRGELTVAQLEDALLNEDKYRIFVINDPSVETKYSEWETTYPEMEPFSEYMSWMRYWGDIIYYDEYIEVDGKIECGMVRSYFQYYD